MAAPNSTSTVNYPLVTNNQAIGVLSVKGLSVATAGDTFVPMPPGMGSGTLVATTVTTTNANVTMATATVGIYTQPAQGGTAILATAALTGQTTNAFAFVRAATSVAAQVPITANGLYINVGTTVATGTVDLYLTYINVS